MKFHCDRCGTRYSIADEKVREKIVSIRCRSCGNRVVLDQRYRVSTSGSRPATAKPVHASCAEKMPAARPSSDGSHERLPSQSGDMEWFMIVDGERSGPFSMTEVARRIEAVGFDKTVAVWKKGMLGWTSPQDASLAPRELRELCPTWGSPRERTLPSLDPQAPTPLPTRSLPPVRAQAPLLPPPAPRPMPFQISDLDVSQGTAIVRHGHDHRRTHLYGALAIVALALLLGLVIMRGVGRVSPL